ncbi:CDF family Co(II)/Ni(II) efflux transporter DmeF [Zavarzinia sp.]|uniref:CDF family Co(II)/Ni(II) efflux transporter DmeF n=1 Tax=Zavarzinia sp. TaxID=2027920 RepID=UPI003BB7C1C3
MTAALDHDHVFLGQDHARNERRTWAVIALTVVTMGVEIAAGTIYGSMALTADGWHMSTHAAALVISALAYRYARRLARDDRFSFGTGKFGDLAGFASAIVLGLVALLIAGESLWRLVHPVAIDYGQAIVVAAIGLAVNLVSAGLLHHGADHHEHDHDHGDHHHHHGHDNNLRAAYLHVLADALTSVLAIAALLAGRSLGLAWLDPVIGVVGALVIARWSIGLMRDAGGTLLDVVPGGGAVADEIRRRLQAEGERVTDLHVWSLGPGHFGVIAALTSSQPQAPAVYRDRLAGLPRLSHVTIEVNAA